MSDNTLKKVQRCTAILESGDQCSQYAMRGTLFCTTHDPLKPNGQGIIAIQAQKQAAKQVHITSLPKTDDPREVIKRELQSKDPDIRLKAAKMLIELEAERACPVCTRRREDCKSSPWPVSARGARI